MATEKKEELRITDNEEQLRIVGMHCATCVTTVSKSLKSVSGVKDAEVNLATGSAKVILSGNVRLKELVKAVRKAGYDVATEKFTIKLNVNPEEMPKIERKFENVKGVVDVKSNPGLGIVSVEYNPETTTPEEILKEAGVKGEIVNEQRSEKSILYKDFHDLLRRLAVGIIFTPLTYLLPFFFGILVSIAVQFYSGLRFHKGAYRALKNKTTNMDVLVSLASNILWLSSIFLHNTFYADASLLITFILVGKTLEAYIKAKMSAEIRIEPYKATLKDGRVVNSNELKVGDVVIVRAGERIPADGIIENGEGEVNEAILTGEQKPVLKKKGDNVLAGGILVNGYLEVYVTRNWDRSYIVQVTESVRGAYNTRVSIQNLVDKVSSIFVPIVISISALTFLVWKFVLDYNLYSSLLFSVAVLAAACPCALGLASPMAMLVSVRRALKRGIIIRDGSIFEEMRNINVAILDKTGTVTEGEYVIVSKKEFIEGALNLAAIAESRSIHPIAKAFHKMNVRAGEIEQFEEFPGRGIYARVNGNDVIVGSKDFVRDNCNWNVEDEGDIFICINGNAGGIVNIRDKLRDDAKKVISYLKGRGIRIIIATGDSSNYADEIGKELGVEVRKELTPDDKAELVKELRENGNKVMFIGDGINDSIAMREADIGIAISSGTDLAKSAGKVVVNSLDDIIGLFEQTELAVRKIKENLAWAFGYNTAIIPIAAGVFYPFITLPPEYAALAMGFSSVIVSLWSLVPI
ncbi:cadmium-translocating P-type ATPase [Saccharolobus solfataricus]|nr:cation-translocating P-type ATPase [Saccharolobus solfataricus]AKA72863.1 cadmium-translocating P-type ATPase [Saccharolobus solfataricus]AKA75561.1 cadmium-translocating P-type ATPase [Saccharolobus solfataricus]AKA78255.1 cadmium-translocating P-type ATPase [Saccharolobus solfataricus]AZF67373.1 cadmium-translocating P-type ATPase [Saccharolobus solfataricus]AZF69993.1 cadmium-translocating P-type ATPase [Saccharolobus solfataricus]